MTTLSKVAAGLMLALATTAMAQTFPSKPIRVIVPYPPGQASDNISRVLAERMTASLGQPVIVENKPGAGGNIGTEAGARAEADGYTVTIATAAVPISTLVYKKLGYDPVKDFEGVTLMTTMPLVLAISPKLNVNSVAELVEYAKKNPGKLNFASSGVGTSHQLTAEMFKQAAGIQMEHVAYKGSPPAHLDLMAGAVDLMFDNIVAVGPHIKSGKLKALAVTSKSRSPFLPDLPTMAEAGFPKVETVAWFGAVVPDGTPSDVIKRLNTEFVKALNVPEVKQRLQETGAQVTPSSPKEMKDFIQSEITKWDKVVSTAKISIE